MIINFVFNKKSGANFEIFIELVEMFGADARKRILESIKLKVTEKAK